MTDGESRGDVAARDAQWPAHFQPEDEISLFDLWAVLVRRKWQILAVTLLVLLLAAAYAVATPAHYRYSLAIDIGSRTDPSGELQPIEPPKAVVAKLENNYIATAVTSFLKQHPDVDWKPKISASNPDSSGIVLLTAEGSTEHEAAYRSLFGAALSQLKADHDKVTQVQRLQLKQDIDSAQAAVKNAQDEVSRLKAETARLDQREKQLRSEVSGLESQLDDLQQQRRQTVKANSGNGESTALLMVNSEIREVSDRLSQLRTELNQEIPDRRDSLASKISEQQNTIEDKRGEMAVLKARLENMSRTRALSDMQRSLRPVGTGNAVIIALGVILGLMLGVFAAFFFEFVSRANAYVRNEASGDSV